MSTPDFDAAVERAARAIHARCCSSASQARFYNTPETCGGPHSNDYAAARAALAASGWEEAAGIARDFATPLAFDDEDLSYTCTQCGKRSLLRHKYKDQHVADCPFVRARAWVAQYTPEGK